MKIQAFKNIMLFNENPLKKEFSIYLEKDKNMALSSIKNGFQPSFLQHRKLQYALANEAKNNINFLAVYKENLSLINNKALVNYFSTYHLDILSGSGQSIFYRFEKFILPLKMKENFSNELRESYIHSIERLTKKILSIKPDSIDRIYSFTDSEKEIYKQLQTLIGNSITLLPITINELPDFVAYKNSVSKCIHSLLDKSTKESFSYISRDGDRIYSIEQNSFVFENKKLCQWESNLKNYNVSYLEKKALEKMRVAHKNSNGLEEIDHESEITLKLRILISHLDSNSQLLVNEIINYYKQINSDSNSVLVTIELNNIYKDTLHTCESFLNINPDYRTTKTNVEGKTSEKIMSESLNHIHDKLKSYIEEIEEHKISLLSAHNRKVKMK